MVHSIEYINDERFKWWRIEYLRKIFKCIDYQDSPSILDVGIGEGHWSIPILEIMQEGWFFTGIDIEEYWVHKSYERLKKHFPTKKDDIRVLQGSAYKLPFADNSFNLVTCQTLFLHLDSPSKALSEFKRVLKPSGYMLIAEPINIFNRLDISSVDENLDIGIKVSTTNLWLYYQEGIRKNNQGNHNIGAFLLNYIQKEKLNVVQIFGNDQVDITTNIRNNGIWWENEEQIRKYATLGGASKQIVESGLIGLKKLAQIKQEQSLENCFSQIIPSSMVIYLIKK